MTLEAAVLPQGGGRFVCARPSRLPVLSVPRGLPVLPVGGAADQVRRMIERSFSSRSATLRSAPLPVGL
ncbi:hypothetical protein H4W27_001173 [Nesterenkonia lutea]|uniref:Uncharacterized protein n=1 Tax=Nesterenkonia lutea TaxID=272919 RepID=A0ABR9JE31_9MICC|nr:hypothetical protein [Nesterenkonia lutea]